MEYQIVRLIDKPEMKEQMAKWFHEKWTVPLQAYLDSMEAVSYTHLDVYKRQCLRFGA